MLVAFPENYRLFEHVKTSGAGAKGVKTTKTHAGGGNERQDAYLYGHPLGRKKRFRSPADFYAHLYWLATDESGDPDNCACKICTPEEFEEPKAVVPKKEVKQETVKQAEMPKREPVVIIPPRAAGQTPARPTATPQPQSTPLPAVRNHEQAEDLEHNIYMFRTGELVWFSRGHAWGLGIVTRRWTDKPPVGGSYRKYDIQPLSHPYGHPAQSTVDGDGALRPWLAWSVPGFTCDGLNLSLIHI